MIGSTGINGVRILMVMEWYVQKKDWDFFLLMLRSYNRMTQYQNVQKKRLITVLAF